MDQQREMESGFAAQEEKAAMIPNFVEATHGRSMERERTPGERDSLLAT